mgnify:CR=1 FL=1
MDRFGPEMGSMLSRFGSGMLTLGTSFVDKFGHRDIDTGADSGVIPVESHAEIVVARPILGKFILVFESGEDMVSVSFTKILDTKIIDSKCKNGATSIVSPEAGRNWNRGVAVGGEMVLELVVGKNTCFFETAHSFANFKIDVAFGIEVCVAEIVGVENLLRDALLVDTHVLEDFHSGDKKEIFQITSAVAGTLFGIGDGAVDV